MTTPRLIVILAGAAMTSATAIAQNALDQGATNDSAYKSSRGSGRDRTDTQTSSGYGRALDANSRVGSGGVNDQGFDWARELALRNALVTGNVGGGRAFRGNVGYSDIADFRASTASDEFFSYERDAESAANVTDPIRGLTGLRMALGQSGNRAPASGDLIVRRTTAGTTAAEQTAQEGDLSKLTVDPFGSIRGALRSTTDNMINMYTRPRVLAKVTEQQDDQEAVLVASPLQSVRSLRYTNPQLSWQELYDPALRRKDPLTQEPQPQNAQPIGQQIEPQEPFLRLRDGLRQQSEQFLARPFGEPAPDQPKPEDANPVNQDAPPVQETTIQRFDRMLEELRMDLLRELDSKQDQPQPAPDTLVPGLRPQEPEKPKPGDDIVERARALLDHGPERVEQLLAQEGVTDFYSLHMLRGQQSLEQSRYFEAEERFTAALSQKQNDPMASVGRIHAQIGAGLYKSAAFNLRALLAAYPETIPARYDPALFPTPQRLERIAAALELHAAQRRVFARDAALLLAYIAHQRGDDNKVKDAFNILEQVAQERNTPTSDLEKILKDVWSAN